MSHVTPPAMSAYACLQALAKDRCCISDSVAYAGPKEVCFIPKSPWSSRADEPMPETSMP